jgi:capsid protein
MSCADKRDDNRDLLNHWTRWRVGLGVAEGELDPRRYGLAWEQIDGVWRWVHRGVPWFDKSREVKGDVDAINAGIQTLGDVIEERLGEDFFDTADRRAKEIEYLRKLGLPVPGEKPAGAATADDVKAAIAEANDDAED